MKSMNSPRHFFLLGAVIAAGLLGFALYLQHGQGLQPCPFCVIQRYAFFIFALVCLLGASVARRSARMFAILASLTGIIGAGAAGWHLWVKAHPAISCGIDPMETALNTLPTANWLPFLFKANGFCSTPTPPILGLSIPMWALLWFMVLALFMGWMALRTRRTNWKHAF